jgi:holo-[acyl-carrier protein] synthase
VDESGEPTLEVSGGARDRLDAITPPGHLPRIHLTMTDDHPFALAVVIITAIAEEPLD